MSCDCAVGVEQEAPPPEDELRGNLNLVVFSFIHPKILRKIKLVFSGGPLGDSKTGPLLGRGAGAK